MAVILGTGIYVPGNPIDNTTVKQMAGVEFDSEKIETVIGIITRHIARLQGIQETTLDFAEKAGRNAIADAGLGPEAINAFIVATDTPEYISPATAIMLQGRLQQSQQYNRAFDVGASCASFVTAFDLACRLVDSDPDINHVLVVGVYNMPAYIRDGDAFGWSLFADGAGAMILGKSQAESASRYIGGKFVADGTQWDYVGVYAGGTKKPITHELLDAGSYGLELLQRLPGDRNIKLWPPLIQSLCDRWSVPLSEIQAFVLTQINRSVIEEVMNILGEPVTKAPMVMDRFGYTGSACIPIAFHEAVQAGKITRGKPVVFCASGAGLAVGANLFVY